MGESYIMNFNQDFTSISVLNNTCLQLYSINATNKIEEIFAKENTQQICIVERLFNTSLVVLVTKENPNYLKMLHFKKKQDICNCVYPSDILCVRMNRQRLVVCLADSIHIHDIRDMKLLHSIVNIPPNEYGLCSLSLNSTLAYQICTGSGELKLFNANKLKPGITIKAHDTALSAMNFSPNGLLLATASERGTVIRLFSVKNGQRIKEFRRGVKRCVKIASLVFSTTGDFLCVSSNTETVHIFKVDATSFEAAKSSIASDDNHKKLNPSATSSTSSKENTSSTGTSAQHAKSSSDSTTSTTTTNTESVATNTSNNPIPASTSTNTNWSMGGYITKTIGDVWSQDRAFAMAQLKQPGLKHICGLARIKEDFRLLVACEDGFLYIYDFDSEKGGICNQLNVHDLRHALAGIEELHISDGMDNASASDLLSPASTSPHSKSSSTSSVSILIENPEPCADNSYAGILKGSENASNTTMTDSVKFRRLCDAIDTPAKLYDERQYPPVAIAAKE